VTPDSPTERVGDSAALAPHISHGALAVEAAEAEARGRHCTGNSPASALSTLWLT
jgi:hypothetical protein